VAYLVQEGSRIFYATQGAGSPTLIFVHGFGCSHRIWDRQIPALAAGRTIIACDLRGHGESEGCAVDCSIELLGRDVAELTRSLGKRAGTVLIGHSLGCRVVLQAYLDAPGSVMGLVLIDGSWTNSADYSRSVQSVEERIQQFGYAAFVQGEIAQMFPVNSGEALREEIGAEAAKLPESIGRPLFLNTMEWDARQMEAALGRVTVPLLILQSTVVMADRTRVTLTSGMSTPWLNLVRRVVGTVQIEIIPGVGHFAMLEAADRVNEAMDGFVKSLAADT